MVVVVVAGVDDAAGAGAASGAAKPRSVCADPAAAETNRQFAAHRCPHLPAEPWRSAGTARSAAGTAIGGGASSGN